MKPFSASPQIERPIAKPTKPSTGAAWVQPVVDLLVVGAAAEQHADHALAALAGAGLLGEHLGVRALVDALDLPDVHLDAGVLDLLDRAPHQLGAQLGVVAVGVAAHLLELRVLGRHEQLEEELAVVRVEPVGEPLQPADLALVHLGVAVGVVADEDLREVGVELLDVLAEAVLAVLEVELVLARTSRPASRASGRAPCAAGGMPLGSPNCSSTSAPVTLGSAPFSSAFSRPS